MSIIFAIVFDPEPLGPESFDLEALDRLAAEGLRPRGSLSPNPLRHLG